MNSTSNITDSVATTIIPSQDFDIYQELQTGSIVLFVSLVALIVGSYTTLSKPKNAKDPRLDTINPKFDPTDLDDSNYYLTEKYDLLKYEQGQFSIYTAFFIPIFACIVLVSLYYLLKSLEDLNYYLKFYILLINPYSLNTGFTSVLTMLIRKITHLFGKNSSWLIERYRLVLTSDVDNYPLGRVDFIEDDLVGDNFQDYLKSEALINLYPSSIDIKKSNLNLVFNLIGLCTVPISLYITYYNFMFNSDGKSWVLSNLLSFTYIVTSFKQLRIPQFKISILLLSLLFFYDIYFVFGTKIMMTVATNIDIPIKLMIPRIGGEEDKFSILGLGDIILPGSLISLCLRFDLYNHHKRNPELYFHHLQSFPKPYFIISLISYSIGLIITWAVLCIFNHGQPALLYLVPSLLIGVLGLSLYRDEFHQLWNYSELINEYKKDKVYEIDEEEDEEYLPSEDEDDEMDEFIDKVEFLQNQDNYYSTDEEDDNTYVITIDEEDSSIEYDSEDELEVDDYSSDEELIRENDELKHKIRSFLKKVDKSDRI